MNYSWLLLLVAQAAAQMPVVARGAQLDNSVPTECAPQTWRSDLEKIHANQIWITDPKTNVASKVLVPKQFISVEAVPEITHGIDLSHWQVEGSGSKIVVDLDKVRKCGAQFAWVKISEAYSESKAFCKETTDKHPSFCFDPQRALLWSAATDLGFRIGPYHFFRAKPGGATKPPEQLDDDSAWKLFVDKTEEDARVQASLFVSGFKYAARIRGGVQGRAFFPIALDLEQEWQQWLPSVDLCIGKLGRVKSANCDDTQQARIYRFQNAYQRAVCAWIDQVRRQPGMSRASFVLYTRGNLYTAYAFGRRTAEEVGCNLSTFPLWLAYYPEDGRPHWRSPSNDIIAACRLNPILRKDTSTNKEVLDIDIANASTACIAHQYSERGRIGIPERKPKDHLDLTRLYLAPGKLESLLWTFTD